MVDPAVHTGASGAKIRPQARVQKHNYHNCQNYRPKPLKTVKFWVKTGPLSGAKILGLPTSATRANGRVSTGNGNGLDQGRGVCTWPHSDD